MTSFVVGLTRTGRSGALPLLHEGVRVASQPSCHTTLMYWPGSGTLLCSLLSLSGFVFLPGHIGLAHQLAPCEQVGALWFNPPTFCREFKLSVAHGTGQRRVSVNTFWKYAKRWKWAQPEPHDSSCWLVWPLLTAAKRRLEALSNATWLLDAVYWGFLFHFLRQTTKLSASLGV